MAILFCLSLPYSVYFYFVFIHHIIHHIEIMSEGVWRTANDVASIVWTKHQTKSILSVCQTPTHQQITHHITSANMIPIIEINEPFDHLH